MCYTCTYLLERTGKQGISVVDHQEVHKLSVSSCYDLSCQDLYFLLISHCALSSKNKMLIRSRMGNFLSWIAFSPLFGFADANSNVMAIAVAGTPVHAGGMLNVPLGSVHWQRFELKPVLTDPIAGIPVLEAFVSYSIEFSSFPDFAGMYCTGCGRPCGTQPSRASLGIFQFEPYTHISSLIFGFLLI